MTVLNAIQADDCFSLKKQLSRILDEWSLGLLGSMQPFESAEMLFQYFILDLLTSLRYGLQRDAEISGRVISNMKQIVLDMEKHHIAKTNREESTQDR